MEAWDGPEYLSTHLGVYSWALVTAPREVLICSEMGLTIPVSGSRRWALLPAAW